VAAVKAAFHVDQTDGEVVSVAFASHDRSYANVEWGSTHLPVAQSSLYRLENRAWKGVFGFAKDESAVGACAFASPEIVRDLYDVDCPPARAVRARPAKGAEVEALRSAFQVSPLTEPYRSEARLTAFCVSRLDGAWAAGIAELPDTAGPIWFQRAEQGWVVRYEDLGRQGNRPPADIVLSLASCSGYNAARYSG
jgi:hypothetical protein